MYTCLWVAVVLCLYSFSLVCCVSTGHVGKRGYFRAEYGVLCRFHVRFWRGYPLCGADYEYTGDGGGLHLFGGLVCVGSCLGLMWLSESTQIC